MKEAEGGRDNGSEIMTLKEAAEYLKCHEATVYRLIQKGGLPGFRVGSDWRFRGQDINKWIASRELRPADSEPRPKARSARGRVKRKRSDQGAGLRKKDKPS
jgi:excisionase family DNA binding protein